MQIPAYIRFVFISLAIIIFFFGLYIAEYLLVPLALAFLLAILLLPLCRFLEGIGLPRFPSVLLTLILAFLLLCLLGFGLWLMIAGLAEDIPQIGEKLLGIVDKFQAFLQKNLDIQLTLNADYIRDSLGKILQRGSAFFSGTVSATANAFSLFVITLISVFFFLYYRSFFRDFLFRIFSENFHQTLSGLLTDTRKLASGYIRGLLLMMLIIGALNTLGLWLLGIDYALLWGALSGLLAVIPYIGISIGALLPALYALVTTDSLLYPLGVLLIFGFVQFLEGNFITPNIMSKSISLNPYAVIIAIFIGGHLWGIAGIILFIPYLAILKNIFDEFEKTRPIGFLLGNPHLQKKNK